MWEAMAEALSLAGDALCLITLEPAGKHLLDEVSAQPALHLGRGPLLGQLEREDGRAVLERAHPALAVGRLIVDSHRQQPKHVRARTNRHQVDRARRPPGVDANLARTGLRYRAGHVEARRH